MQIYNFLSESTLHQIEQIKKYCEIQKPLLVIHCATYNHESYIRETLEGFVKQQTKFPFIAIVHDDASTDGTSEIVKEFADKYPDIIKPIFEEENLYSKPGKPIREIMNKAIEVSNARYVAMCEGDDYWIDSHKLQMQVEFLESHLDYGMCYTKMRKYIQISNKFTDICGGPNETLEELIYNNTIPTLTVVLRSNLMFSFFDEIHPERFNWKMTDLPLWIFCASKMKIKFINKLTSIYRVLENSASHSTDYLKKLEFTKSIYDIIFFFSSYLNIKIKSNILLESKIIDLEIATLKGLTRKNEIKREIMLLPKKDCSKLLYIKAIFVSLFPKVGTILLKFKSRISRI